MCIGESLDTLTTNELSDLRARALSAFPAHMFAVQVNTERMAWAVLEPPTTHADLLRFTICRVAPSILVLVEDAAGRRQICSADGIEAAMTYARQAADRMALFAMNVHPPHAVRQ